MASLGTPKSFSESCKKLNEIRSGEDKKKFARNHYLVLKLFEVFSKGSLLLQFWEPLFCSHLPELNVYFIYTPMWGFDERTFLQLPINFLRSL